MEKRIETLVNRLSHIQGAHFTCDKDAVIRDYHIKSENHSSTIAIKILSVLGGFLATLTFLGFLFIGGLYDSKIGLVSFGVAFIVSAFALNKMLNKTITDTFSISLYVTGLCLLAFGLGEMDIGNNYITLLIGLIAVCSLLITQNYIISFVSVLIINSCFVYFIVSNKTFKLIDLYMVLNTILLTYLFLNEARIYASFKKLTLLFNAIRMGVICSLLFGFYLMGNNDFLPNTHNSISIASIVLACVLLYLVTIIIKINAISLFKHKVLIYLLTTAILIFTLFSPAITGAIIILLLSFLVNYKTGVVMGVVSIIYFISQYYYDLNLTLLSKSIILFITGIFFIIFYVYITKNPSLK